MKKLFFGIFVVLLAAVSCYLIYGLIEGGKATKLAPSGDVIPIMSVI